MTLIILGPRKIKLIDRYYKNINAETVINELISNSSPNKEKKIFFVWPEGIIPNTYEDQLNLYNVLVSPLFEMYQYYFLTLYLFLEVRMM